MTHRAPTPIPPRDVAPHDSPAPSSSRGDRSPSSFPSLALASRGDALTTSLLGELRHRYSHVQELGTDLTPRQRALVAAATFRPDPRRWRELFYKSSMAYRFRTANALAAVRAFPDVPVLQVHALFEIPGTPSYLYVDCTHHQSATWWPDWNPLSPRALNRWYERERRHYQRAEHVFAFSRATRDSLVDHYGMDPRDVTVVGAGVNVGLEHAARQEPGLRSPTSDAQPAPRLLFVGNDFLRKGGPDLLSAFQQLRRTHPSARLDLVGTRPGITPSPGVRVHGRVHDRARVAELFAAADVFVLPTHFDPLPLVLLEAMAIGVPVVTTASCGIPDVLTDGREGRIVPAGAPEVLAATLAQVLDDASGTSRMARAARERVLADFTWRRVVDRMTPILGIPVSC